MLANDSLCHYDWVYASFFSYTFITSIDISRKRWLLTQRHTYIVIKIDIALLILIVLPRKEI